MAERTRGSNRASRGGSSRARAEKATGGKTAAERARNQARVDRDNARRNPPKTNPKPEAPKAEAPKAPQAAMRDGTKSDRFLSPSPLRGALARAAGALGFALEPTPAGRGSDRVPDRIADTGKRVAAPPKPRGYGDVSPSSGRSDSAPSRASNPSSGSAPKQDSAKPVAKKTTTKKSDSYDSMDLNKLTKAGISAKEMNKMSRAELKAIYDRVTKKK